MRNAATADEQPGVDSPMEETVVYQPQDLMGSGPSGPSGLPDMRQANPTPQAGGRYTFGSGSRPLDGYTIKRAIGRGGFGEVYYATSDSGKEVALKLILRNLDVERRGVMQCMNLKCPNLLTIYDLKENDAGDAFVVMEYVAGPSLASVLKQHPNGMPLAEVRHWLKGLVEGVAYLHDHGIVHRDLKPANLFIEEGLVKIGDYGLAKLITPSQGTEHSESIGTCHYMAPEIGSGKYNKPIDVYAIGIILFEMITGRVPFEGETVNEVLMKHLTARPDVSMLPEPYRSIVAKALAKDPEARQQRVYDLLPTSDAPREPEVRIIGDAKAGGAATATPEEDILRIEAEEPVFYIGPETRPPRRQSPTLAQQIRDNWREMRREVREARRVERRDRREARRNGVGPIPASYQRRAPQPPPRPAAPPPPPPAPPEPPALPSGRVRFAELTASMLWAAPLMAVLTMIAAIPLELNLEQSPEQAAYLYIMGLLGTWMALIPGKYLEVHRLEPISRRLVTGAAGLFTGFAGLCLAQLLRLDLAVQTDYFAHPLGLLPYYFAVLYAINAGWWGRTVRDRSSRFRIRSILWTALLATALVPLWPYQRRDDIALALMIVTAVQAVSPWNPAAAAYARYVKATRKQQKKRQNVV